MTAKACRPLAAVMLLLASNAAAQKADETPDAVRKLIAAEASLEPAQEFLLLQAIPTGEKLQWQETALGGSSRSPPLEGVRR